jgi:hypothetical protein
MEGCFGEMLPRSATVWRGVAITIANVCHSHPVWLIGYQWALVFLAERVVVQVRA